MDVSIDGIRVAEAPAGPVPVVLLAPDPGGDDPNEDGPGERDERALPIYIGFEEAQSIARGQDAIDVDRPLTHDLMLDVLEEVGARVERVVVSTLEEGTYHADLHFQTPRGTATADARPSDSLALAARTRAPITVDDDLFEAEAQPRDSFEQFDDIREVLP